MEKVTQAVWYLAGKKEYMLDFLSRATFSPDW